MKIFCDFNANQNNIKGQIILIIFRLVSFSKNNSFLFLLLLPLNIFYRVVIEWIIGCEIPYKTEIGEGVKLYHGHALVINDGTKIGKNCTIRHSTTIGNKQLVDGSYSRCPIIGNNVDIGSNVVIIGPITIGDNVTIGAGSVVVKDIVSNSIVAGNPAIVLRKK